MRGAIKSADRNAVKGARRVRSTVAVAVVAKAAEILAQVADNVANKLLLIFLGWVFLTPLYPPFRPRNPPGRPKFAPRRP